MDPLAIEAVLRPSVLLLKHKDQLTWRWTSRRGRTAQLSEGPSPLGPSERLAELLGDGDPAEFTREIQAGAAARFYRLTIR
jgi:hypothetical protein